MKTGDIFHLETIPTRVKQELWLHVFKREIDLGSAQDAKYGVEQASEKADAALAAFVKRFEYHTYTEPTQPNINPA